MTLTKKWERGFTLIEMMITLAILGTLAAAALPAVSRHQQQKKEEVLSQSLRELRSAIDRYALAAEEGIIDHRNNDSPYPSSLRVLTEGVVDKNSPTGKKIFFLRRVPRDPFCECEASADHETWRVRSYLSDPERFDGGEDVYDVSSTSPFRGLNGVPYAQW